MTNRCWVSLVYDWGEDGLPIGSTDAPHVLRQVAEDLLVRAREAAALSRWVDSVKATLDRAEVERLERVLGLLLGREVVNASA